MTGGEGELRTYESSEHGRRQFCKRCGSQLFCWHEAEGGSPPRVIDIALALEAFFPLVTGYPISWMIGKAGWLH